MRAGERTARAGQRRLDRVPLLRHRRRAATRRLAHFVHLRLGEQDDVEPDLSADSRDRRERRAELGDAHAVRVPRQRRHGQLELPRERVDDAHAVVPQRRERPGRPAELHREAALTDLLETRAGIEQRDEPAGRDQAERGRDRLLEERSRRHRRRAVLAGERRARVCCRVDVSQHQSHRVAGDEHRRRVEHVLARRPQMDEALVLLADAGTERTDERLRGVADRTSVVQQPVPAVRVGIGARRGDRICGRAGNEADRCAGRGQRTLHLEHRLQPRSAGDRLAELGGDEQRVERGHTAKNVVCDGPWRRMSKRRPPSSATATSVSRCSGGRRESTGSSAFASVSSGK